LGIRILIDILNWASKGKSLGAILLKLLPDCVIEFVADFRVKHVFNLRRSRLDRFSLLLNK
jgi:hypothetical protein